MKTIHERTAAENAQKASQESARRFHTSDTALAPEVLIATMAFELLFFSGVPASLVAKKRLDDRGMRIVELPFAAEQALASSAILDKLSPKQSSGALIAPSAESIQIPHFASPEWVATSGRRWLHQSLSAPEWQ